MHMPIQFLLRLTRVQPQYDEKAEPSAVKLPMPPIPKNPAEHLCLGAVHSLRPQCLQLIRLRLPQPVNSINNLLSQRIEQKATCQQSIIIGTGHRLWQRVIQETSGLGKVFLCGRGDMQGYGPAGGGGVYGCQEDGV